MEGGNREGSDEVKEGGSGKGQILIQTCHTTHIQSWVQCALFSACLFHLLYT